MRLFLISKHRFMIYLWSKYFFTTRLKQRSFKILLQSTRFEHAAPSFFFFPFLIYLLMWNVFYSTSVGRSKIRQSHRELFFNLFRHLVDLGKMLALMRQKLKPMQWNLTSHMVTLFVHQLTILNKNETDVPICQIPNDGKDDKQMWLFNLDCD